MTDGVQVPVEEVVKLAAVDDNFYCAHFFPKTFRQGMPEFSWQFNAAFNDPSRRYIGFKMFRGSAKTTRIRARVSKHIAYAISRTILFVSNSQRHSIYSLRWLRRQVEFNTLWAQTYGLSKGKTWSEEIIEIRHAVAKCSIYVVALGITGQIRGINIEDFRPDFIVLDDPDNEETTATPDQREKTSELVFGALIKSLAPPTEAPHAKVAIAQTPFNKFDLIATCEKDEAWHVATIGCFDTRGKSTWEARFSTEFLEQEKQQHIRMNKLSLWMREMECRIVAKELATFRVEWLQYWEVLPEDLTYIVAIDPAASDSKDADDQVIGVLGFRRFNRKTHVYVVEYSAERGEMPDVAGVKFLEYKRKWRPLKAACESVAYQRVLAWYLENLMRQHGQWLTIDKVQDKRRKSDRIQQELGDIAGDFRLYCRPEHTKFIEQFSEYSPLASGHDDVLDMVAIGVASYRNYLPDALDGEYERLVEDERGIPELEAYGVAP
jgi:hypothetical protein